jgi:hypothetical protein
MPKCPGGRSLLGGGHHDLERATSAQGARSHIDEFSMVDVVLMAQLLWAIPDQAPVCMVSAVDQLSGRALVCAALGQEFPVSTLWIVERVPSPTIAHVSSRPP